MGYKKDQLSPSRYIKTRNRPNDGPNARGPKTQKSFDDLRNGVEASLGQLEAKRGTVSQQKILNGSDQARNESASQDPRGKKRSHEGHIVNGAGNPGSLQEHSTAGSPTGTLEAEVIALGGSREDIELIGNVVSDSEYEETELLPQQQIQQNKTGKKGQDVETGIRNILKEIALAQGNPTEVDERTDESENEPLKTSIVPKAKPGASMAGSKQKSEWKCEARSDWFVLSTPSSADDSLSTLPQRTADEVHTFAKKLLQEDNDAYQQTNQSSSSQSFYKTVIVSGTLSDKISALTLAVQESPVHNVRALETLLGLAKKRSRSQAVDVLRALKDLFAQGSLLPSDRRLYTFATQPALLQYFGKKASWKAGEKLPRGIEEQDLILWAFESWLKEQYFEMLKTLEVWCNDEIEFAKTRAISYVSDLLREKPEQESNLLRLLVNKLGDPVKKIASHASYQLMQLLATHPAMKKIVVSAIEADFIFRPGQSLHGRYYAAVTLNQTALSSQEEGVAEKLLGIYFGLFSSLLKTADDHPKELDEGKDESHERHERRRKPKKQVATGQLQTDELREKLTSALLTGVNRAYPYVGSSHKSFSDHLDTLFKIAHSANFNTSVQAMLLIQQLAGSHQPFNDRFYRVLYESLLDPRLITASKQQLYLNLLHRALKADMNTKRVKAFVKRILQIMSLHEPSFICGAFFLLKDLESTFPGLTSLVDQQEEDEVEQEYFQDVDDDRGTSASLRTSLANGIVKHDSSKYDAHKRAPEFANADKSCAWELWPFLAHFHPSVTVSADRYIGHEKLPGKPDLTLHTLVHFLDRFVYRNAKLSDTKIRGSSIMQPMASDNSRAVLFSSSNMSKLPVNSEEFKAKKGDHVAAEDLFFHRYFANAGKNTSKKGKRKGRTASDIGDDEEDAVWKAMLESAPDLEADEDDDNLEMSDLESEMGKVSSGDSAASEDLRDDDGSVDVEAGVFDDEDADLGGSDAEEMGSDLDILEESDDSVDAEQVSPAVTENAAKSKKKKMKSLPTFASADDYAKMLEDDDGEDIS